MGWVGSSAWPVSRGHRGRWLPPDIEHADGGVPDHPRLGRPAGRRSGHHGGDRRRTAERRLGEIPGVTEITSSSPPGSTNITIQFDLGRSIDGAARDVQAALNAALTDLPGICRPCRPCARSTRRRRRS